MPLVDLFCACFKARGFSNYSRRCVRAACGAVVSSRATPRSVHFRPHTSRPPARGGLRWWPAPCGRWPAGAATLPCPAQRRWPAWRSHGLPFTLLGPPLAAGLPGLWPATEACPCRQTAWRAGVRGSLRFPLYPSSLYRESLARSSAMAAATPVWAVSRATRRAFLMARALERPCATMAAPLTPSSGTPPYSA